MRRLYIHLTPQKFDTCPFCQKDIARTYGDMIMNLEFNNRNNKKDPNSLWCTASYCFPTFQEDLFDICTIVYPNGTTDTMVESDFRYILKQYKEAGQQIHDKGPKSAGMGPQLAVSSAYYQWLADRTFEGRDSEIEETMKNSLQSLKEDHSENERKVLTDADIMKLVCVNAGLNGGLEIKKVVFNGQELVEDKDISDFVDLQDRVIIKNDSGKHILPNQILIDDMNKYNYTVFFQDNWRYERSLEGAQIYHNDELELEIE